MLNDMAALAPSLVVCVAIVIAVAAFLRHEMRRGDREGTDGSADISEDGVIASGTHAPAGTPSDDGIAGEDAASSR